jgi:hypothetical protein
VGVGEDWFDFGDGYCGSLGDSTDGVTFFVEGKPILVSDVGAVLSVRHQRTSPANCGRTT